jgi:hypothetical protein
MTTISSSLNMTPSALKSKSLGSRSFKISINPRNGNTFGSLDKIELPLPSMNRTYADLRSAVVRGKIKTVHTTTPANADNVTCLDTNIYSVVDRLEISTSSAVLDNIPNFNVLMHTMKDMTNSMLNTNGISYDLLLNGGDMANPNMSQFIGSGDVTEGQRDFAMPLPSIGLLGIDKLLPLSAVESPMITLHLADLRDCLLSGTRKDDGTYDSAEDPDNYELSEIELFLNVVELTTESSALIEKSVGSTGFVIDYENVDVSQFQKGASVTSLTQNLATRVSALSKVLVVMRNSANLQNINQLTLSNRGHFNLSEASLFIAGNRYPNLPIKMTNVNQTQVLHELLLFEGGMGNAYYHSAFNIPKFIDYEEIDQINNNGVTAGTISNALHKALGGVVATNDANRNVAFVGSSADNQNFTHIRPATTFANATRNQAFKQLSNFAVENGYQPTQDERGNIDVRGATGLTRATAQKYISTFALGFQLSTFLNNENLYNNISTIGSNVSLELKFSGSPSTTDGNATSTTFNVYSFYHNIVVLDPTTRMWSVQSV